MSRLTGWGILGLLAVGSALWWMMRSVETSGLAGSGLPRSMTSTAMAGVSDGDAVVAPQVPATLSDAASVGKQVFLGKCAECHGENAAGIKGAGPPLVHKIYEPSRHADFSFVLAVQNGVRAHHWPFGDMPPVKGMTQADVRAITAYVRELQRENSIGVE